MREKQKNITRRKFLKTGASAGAAAAAVGVAGVGKARAQTDKPEIYPDQDTSEVRWGFLVDLRRCVGCNGCAVACKTEFDVRLGRFRNGVITYDSGTYPDAKRDFVPWICNHCKKPPCLAKCPVEPVKASLEFPSGEKAEYWARATYQRPDGLVLVDQERCVGCGECVKSCPYNARYLDPVKAAGGDPASVGLSIASPKASDKCSLCIHRMENGVVPACVNTCQADARLVGNLNDSSSEISKRIAEAGDDAKTLLSSLGTEPAAYYIGLNDDAYSKGDEPRSEAGLQTVVDV